MNMTFICITYEYDMLVR